MFNGEKWNFEETGTRLFRECYIEEYNFINTKIERYIETVKYIFFSLFFLLLINIAEILFMVSMFVHRCLKSKIVIALSLSIELRPLVSLASNRLKILEEYGKVL